MHDLVIRSTRVVTPYGTRPAAVAVRDGRITGVLPYDTGMEATERTDLGTLALLPGLVDTHVHVNEPGRTEWEGFATATRAAAAGGVTTIVDMPLNSLPPTTTVAALEEKRAAAYGQCAVDVGFWGGAVPANTGADTTELERLHAAGVFGFKCFLSDSGVAEFPPLDDAALRRALTALAPLGSLMVVHAEDDGELSPLPPGSTGHAAFEASRPRISERRAIERVIGATRATGARTHIVHLSAAECLPILAAAKGGGLPVTVETCPHYLFFAAEEVPDGATAFKCCPPIRNAANRAALWRGLAAGEIDCVVSDHSPCTPDLKASADFATAWGGVASLQLGLSVVWTAASRHGFGLSDVAAWMARGPAALVGMSRKGAIAAGNDADLVAFDPDARFTVDPEALEHRNPVTPYTGRTLRGAVRTTWLRGTPIDPDTPHGRLLTREDA
ncbi:MAG TPA: allantoinase AllB [Streptosporangiaceae bacterium]|jgi:allantoinase